MPYDPYGFDDYEPCYVAALQNSADEICDFYVPRTIETVPKPQSDSEILSFYRKYVSKNIPVKISGCIDRWAASTKWKSDIYLLEKLGDTEVTMTVTPNGLADSICKNPKPRIPDPKSYDYDGKVFALPYETKITFKQFIQHLNTSAPRKVVYLQKQNDSFNLEFSKLMSDIDVNPEWSSKVFGTKLDAVNFWMGDGRAVTSLHKDPYENIYSVVRGSKTFTLLPPCDRLNLRYEGFETYQYDENGELHPFRPDSIIDPDNFHVTQWIDVDPLNPLAYREGLSEHLHPLEVTVNEGETLYLPSYWFHHVTQTHKTIAVNYWYDIDYGPAYGIYQTFNSCAIEKFGGS